VLLVVLLLLALLLLLLVVVVLLLLLLLLAALSDSRRLNTYAGGGRGTVPRGATSFCNILFVIAVQRLSECCRTALGSAVAAAASAMAVRNSSQVMCAMTPLQ
jgi:hypothetical protein